MPETPPWWGGRFVLLVPALQQEIARLDSDMPLSNVRTMKHVFVASTAHRRFATLLIELFMAIALALSRLSENVPMWTL
jgi:hypothetical protein